MKIAVAATLVMLLAGAAPCGAGVDLPRDVASGWDFDVSLRRGFRPWGYKLVSIADGHPVRAGKQSLRFEVRPGDCSENSMGHDDCATDRERHELVQIGRTQEEGDEWWYAWSLYLPLDYPNVYPTKVALAQFHQHPEVIWMFRNKDGGYFVNRQEELGRGYGFDRILEDADMRGLWNDMLVHARWTRKGDGYFKVWVSNVLVYDYKGPTMGADTTVYFKIGIYRTFVSRYKKAKGVQAVPAQVVYFDEVRRGKTRADVAIGARSR